MPRLCGPEHGETSVIDVSLDEETPEVSDAADAGGGRESRVVWIRAWTGHPSRLPADASRGRPMGAGAGVRGNQTDGETGETLEKRTISTVLSVTWPLRSLISDLHSYKTSTLPSRFLPPASPARSCSRHIFRCAN